MTAIDIEADKKIRAIKKHVLTEARNSQDDVRVEVNMDRGGYELKVTQVPLDHYYRSRVISLTEYRAGNRLFRDFYISGQSSNLTVNLNPVRCGEAKSFLPVTQMQRDALDSYRKAMQAISGKIGQLMVNNVCCFGYWLKDMKYLHYKDRSAMDRFHEALNDLIDFYKTS